MTRYYVDTNIWLDLLESRISFLKPFGEFAFQFFKKCLDRKEVVLYSDLTLEELESQHDLNYVEKNCFSLLKGRGLLDYVEISEQQSDESAKIAVKHHVPKPDALHAILARDNGAVIITRDKHFNLLQDIAKSFTPEEVS